MSFRGLLAPRPVRRGALLLAISRRFGASGLVIILTTATTICSVSLAMSAMAVLWPNDPTSTRIVFWLSLGIPLLVSPVVSIAIVRLLAHLSAANAALEQLAGTDPLTGVLNRRGFFEACNSKALASRPALIGIVDIDQFKALNDSHGHAFGDEALCVLALGLRSLLGADAVIGRLGGDEFAFVVCKPNDFTLRALQQRLAFPVTGDVTLWATVGVSELDPGVSTRESMGLALSRADSDLYLKKVSRTGADMHVEPRVRSRAR
jgi:diguanylate cyclase (GGDEF)-like protein